ncbi:NAD(P)H-binding protein [Sporomusa sp. KB1]|jgi:uncharacterized protein YbjT (DUF2867 family)|uniref:NAD(P)H-binding protein n=1 Tax=Sporomusa sp. KB1 TaxID=943346 RepID=UPI0011A9D928|nr:NAD(P)H-binding protein [Sporomusa sp. KB1]TWH51917.1 putative NAD(P)-binding protein [Sporomusa sp. KB1]
MKVIIFGATGMIGRSVLQECLCDAEVDAILTVGRSVTGIQHEKLKEILHTDLLDLSTIEVDLTGYDACFFCIGVSSSGMKEREYQLVTYDITMAVAQILVKLNSQMTFIYISGAGADSTEQGRVMWARVKGKTENALMRLPFNGVYMFRPAYIQPCNGIVSRTKLYRVMYSVLGSFYPVLKRIFPKSVTTTEILGRTMIKVAKQGAPTPIIESRDIHL